MEYWKDGDWYVGQILEVPGVMSQGATLRELEQNIWDAYWLISPKTIGIHEAKARLPALLAQVVAGQHFIITKRGQPVAQLIPLERQKPLRRPGLLKGRIRIARDFDAPIMYTNEPLGPLKVIPDFLPSPEELAKPKVSGSSPRQRVPAPRRGSGRSATDT